MDFSGKVVLVLGATCGVGNELCLAIAKNGGSVIALGKDKTKLEKLSDLAEKDNSKITLIHMDITQHAMLPAMVNMIYERFGKVDIVINLISFIMESTLLLHTSDDIITKSVNINITSQILLAKYITPLIEKSSNPLFVYFTCDWTHKMAYNLLFNSGKIATETALKNWAQEIINPEFKLIIFNPGIFASKTRRKIFPDENHDHLAKPIEIIEKLFTIIKNKENSLIEG